MRSISVVVIAVLVDGVSQVPLADRDDAIETFRLDRSHKPLRIRIQVRTAWRELDGVHAVGTEHFDHGLSEHRITVMEQVLVVSQESIKVVELLTQRVVHPFATRSITNPCDLDAACSDIDDEEHMEPGEPFLRPYLDREEVHRCDDAPMHLQKLSPCGAFGSRWRGFKPVFLEDIGDGGAGDAMTEFAQLTLDPLVTPMPVLGGHSDDELTDLAHDPRSASSSGCAPVMLLSDELAVPSQDGVGFDDRADFRQRLAADCLAEHSKSSSLIVGESEPPVADLLAQNPDSQP